jgi:hypothetical protein
MPNKSKRNRRYIAPKRELTGSAVSNNETDSPINTARTDNPGSGYNNSIKASPIAAASGYFLRELKWISVSAVSVIILLILSYYIFR